MKKMLFICIVLIISTKMAYCLDPLRISVTTTPSVTSNLIIDLLQPNGTLISQVYSETGKSSGSSGILSVLLQGGTWAITPYNKDDLIRVTFNSVVLSIERLDVSIGRQSLYGPIISADVIDQADDYSLKSLLLTGDLGVGGKTTLNKLVGNVVNYTLSSISTTIDLSAFAYNTMILNITGSTEAGTDIVNLANPISGQILILHNYSISKSITINNTHTISPNSMRLLVYINSKWHPISFATEF